MPDVSPSTTPAARTPAADLAYLDQTRPEQLARFTALRRLLRWFNLTIIHQGPWPLALLLVDAPNTTLSQTPWGWFLIRLGAPLFAALLATLYLLQLPDRDRLLNGILTLRAAVGRSPTVATVLFGLTFSMLIARLVNGPLDGVLRILSFGLADVAAYQLIHFAVLSYSYPSRESGRLAAVIFFGVSYALRAALMIAFGDQSASLTLATLGAGFVGLVLAGLITYFRDWSRSLWLPVVAHWLVVYLIAAFASDL